LQDTFYRLLNDLTHWLNQLLPLYWLVSALLISLVWVLLLSSSARKKLRALDKEREYLSIEQATNSQKIGQLDGENQQLYAKVNLNADQIGRLVAESAELKSSRDEKALQLDQNEKERLGLREMHENNQRKIARLEADMREQQAHLQAEQNKLTELKVEFERQKTELKNEFKVVSEEVIKERQAMLTEQNKQGVGALLKPLQDQIDGFQKRVNEVHDASVKGHSHLRAEIENVMKMGIKMSDEASNLTTALKVHHH